VRSIPAAVALLMVVLTISSMGALFFKSASPPETLIFKSEPPSKAPLSNAPPPKMAQGALRCEGAGAVVINIDGVDYAVNGMASRRYPPVQRVWNSASHPENDIDRIIVRGLTLCDWGSTPTVQASAMN
jgi:hypothetical protein